MGRLDLRGAARQAMLDNGFVPELPVEAARELAGLPDRQPAPAGARDLRDIPWTSIDNDDSRDLDQLEASERLPDGGIRVRVAVADVDALVTKGSALDRFAGANTTSVYTGVVTFPMLPEQLSTDRTSLNEDADRIAMVVEFTVATDGSVHDPAVFWAQVRNHAQLAYDAVGHWLEGESPAPKRLAGSVQLAEQVKMQDEAAGRLRLVRYRNGALDLETIEARPVMKDGVVVDLDLTHKTRARELIEDFMIASNTCIAGYLEGKQVPSLRRVVRVPKRWDRIVEVAAALGEKLPADPDARALAEFLLRRRTADPLRFPDLSLTIVKLLGRGEYVVDRPGEVPPGHFGLAVEDYTHSTAPNRRYADLITQRLVKAALAGRPSPYTAEELDAIAARCTLKENDAQKAERLIRKMAAASLLAAHVGERYDAIVTGDTAHGVYVRLLKPPVEGRVVRNEEGLDVGDRTRVRLIATDPARGFIDFERVGGQ
jgi:VacB/RNase II family 3'-5' exoribonuclease